MPAAKQYVELYESFSSAKKLRHASTRFCPEGSLILSDDDEQGELAGEACRALMKCLWLGRLARPDIVKPIGDMASKVQCWNKNCDKQLYRLVCYIRSTAHHKLVGVVSDSLRTCVCGCTWMLTFVETASIPSRPTAATMCYMDQTLIFH